MKNILIAILITLLAFAVLWCARSYSGRPIETSDLLIVTSADGNEYLKKWQDVTTFVEGDIDNITGDMIFSDSVYFADNVVIAGDVADSTYFSDNVTIAGNLHVEGSSVVADSAYIGGNLVVNGVIYGLDAYCVANVTTAGDTMTTDTLDVYRNLTTPFTNRFVYNFTVTDSGIIYTGDTDRVFEVTASVSYSTNKTSNVITHAFAKNDTVCACSEFPYKTQTAGYYGVASLKTAFLLTNGDRITLIVKSDTADTSIYYHKYVTSIMVVR